jgi:hypothetical protein
MSIIVWQFTEAEAIWDQDRRNARCMHCGRTVFLDTMVTKAGRFRTMWVHRDSGFISCDLNVSVTMPSNTERGEV